MPKLPCCPFSGSGLGIAYSSFDQIGNLFPARVLGQAGGQLYLNVATGNAVFFAPAAEVAEANETLHLGYVYNGFTGGQGWHFTLKRLAYFPPPPYHSGHIIVVEPDGHETPYEFDESIQKYQAPPGRNGRATLSYNTRTQEWEWLDPTTGRKEFYNAAGLLLRSQDEIGRMTQYQYDPQNRLGVVVSYSGCRYVIHREDRTIRICMQNALEETELQRVEFDDQGYLIRTRIGSYAIQYTYDRSNHQLVAITQDDGTVYRLGYTSAGPYPAVFKLASISYGQEPTSEIIQIHYDQPQPSSTQWVVAPCTVDQRMTTFKVDPERRLVELHRETGDLTPGSPDITRYQYTPAGELGNVIYPNHGNEWFEWGVNGLVVHHVDSSGHEQFYQYDATGTLVIKKQRGTEGSHPRFLVTRYVYDYDFDHRGEGHRVLRFILSPLGAVTEYRYDSNGMKRSDREYLVAYDVSRLTEEQCPSLQEMLAWVSHQLPGEVTLVESDYNLRGQVTERREYTHVDDQGRGKPDEEMEKVQTEWTWFDEVSQQKVLVEGNKWAVTTRSYDALQRVIQVCEAAGAGQPLEALTQYQYLDSQRQKVITRPNHRKEVSRWDTEGLVVSEDQKAQSGEGMEQNRTVRYGLDSSGRCIKTCNPDHSFTYQFFDRQDRLVYEVNTEGVVTGYLYSAQHRFKLTTQYFARISIPSSEVLPTVDQLRAELTKKGEPDPSRDRTTGEFYDESGRISYQVDAEHYVTEYRYDSLDHKIAIIQYRTVLTDDELKRLQNGMSLHRVPKMTEEDRWQQFFYDGEGQKIGEQDAAGYVTEYRLDTLGRVIEEIHYAKPTLETRYESWKPDYLLTLDQVRPLPSPDDIHHYLYWDGRDQLIGEIDGERYLTTYQYLPLGNDKPVSKKRFANPVKGDPAKIKDLSQLKPDPSDEDQEMQYQYDLLGREVKKTLSTEMVPSKETKEAKEAKEAKKAPSMGTVTTTERDVMGDVTQVAVFDMKDSQKEIEKRRTLSQYDGWQQKVAVCRPLVSDILARIDADPGLTPAQKEAQKKQVWKTQSDRLIYDDHGLLLRKIDSLGRVTRYYYDDGYHVCFTVDPRGIVKEIQLNVFGDVVLTRHYAKFMNAQTLATLTGGRITPEIQKLFDDLKEDQQDRITQTEFNLRGLKVRSVDAERYETRHRYDAYRECTEDQQAVGTHQPTKTVSHSYELRGLETETKTTAGALVIAERFQYENPLGKRTESIDALGVHTQEKWDRCGRRIQVIDPEQRATTIGYDAFRMVSETNPAGETTERRYVQKQRQITICRLSKDRTVMVVDRIETRNAFGEIVVLRDGLNAETTMTYAPDGQVVCIRDPLGRLTQDRYNLCGEHTSHLASDGTETEYDRDGSGNCETMIEDVRNLALKTRYTHNAFNESSEWVDPAQVTHQEKFDRRGLVVQTRVDPTGLSLVTQRSYDGERSETGEVKGDGTVLDQYHRVVERDPLGRETGRVIDPTRLKIKTVLRLDALGQVIAEVDPNGNITRHFYDDLHRKVLSIDPMGGATEWMFDVAGREIQKREYATAIDPKAVTDQTTLKEALLLVKTKASTADKIRYQYYDTLGRLVYIATSLGAVTQKFYDAASREIKTTHYRIPVTPRVLPQLSTEGLTALITPDPADRTTYVILDQAGQERFVIDPEGFIVESQFDAMGRVIARTAYTNRVEDPAKIAILPADQVRSHLKPDPENDRTTYTVFDARGKVLFTVGARGEVQAKTYDFNGNLLTECQYADMIKIPSSYVQLVSLLKTLQPQKNKDRYTQYAYDCGNRRINKVDPAGCVEKYTLDALGQKTQEIDRANAEHHTEYDRACRKNAEKSPAIDLTRVNPDPSNPRKLMARVVAGACVVKVVDHDPAGNERQVQVGFETSTHRTLTQTVQFDYDACNRVRALSVANVAVDTPEKAASFETRPEQEKTVTKTIVYDGRGLKLVTQDERGHWHFYIYDSECQLRYEVDSLGAVKETVFNAFGEPESTIHYAIPLDIDLSRYATTGLPLKIVQDKLKPSSEDRVVTQTYDHCGNQVYEQEPETFYYFPEVEKSAQPEFGMAASHRQSTFNAFHEETSRKILIQPASSKHGAVYAESRVWFDVSGNQVATSDSLRRVKRFQVNSFKEVERKVEYATVLPQAPTSQMTLAELDQTVQRQASPEDRSERYVHDVRGKLSQKMQQGVVVQALTFSETGIPNFQDRPVQDLVTSYAYNPTELQVSETNPAGYTTYTYYNARKDKVAETGVPRETVTADGKKVTLIPLTVYGVGLAGSNKPVRVTKYKQGSALADLTHFPVPIAEDPDDQTTLEWQEDATYRVLMEQDAEGVSEGTSYTATGKVVRTWHVQSNWGRDHSLPPKFIIVQSIDEERFTFDGGDRQVETAMYRDNVQTERTLIVHNFFGEPVNEGPGDGTWPVYRRFDRRGVVWASNNEKGVPVIYLRDLCTLQTAKLQSAPNDLSDLKQVSYDQLGTMLQGWGADVTKLERMETIRDFAGRPINQITPAYWSDETHAPQNMPLDIVILERSDRKILSWATVVESNLIVSEVRVYPLGHPEHTVHLTDIRVLGDRTEIDISELSTDVYEYEIDFRLTDALQSTFGDSARVFQERMKAQGTPVPFGAVQYQTQGRFQVDSNRSESSHSLVTFLEADRHTLRLTGRIQGLTAVELRQGETVIATLPVTVAPGETRITLDLSAYTTGDYCVKPVYQTGEGLVSLPFSLETTHPSPTPFGYEMGCSASLIVDGTAGDLTWTLPELFQTHPITVKVSYVDTSGSTRSQTVNLTPTVLGMQSTGHFIFDYAVRTIKQLMLSVQIDGQWVTLLDEKPIVTRAFDPTEAATSAAATAPSTYSFAPTVILYIVPIPGWVTGGGDITFEYWDSSMDRLAAWKKVNLIFSNLENRAIAVPVTGFDPGKYAYRIKQKKTVLVEEQTFWLLAGGQVYKSNPEEVEPISELIRPLHPIVYDVWDQPVSQQDSLGYTTTMTYNFRNQLLVTTHPIVPVVNEHGEILSISPREECGYSITGQLVGTRDANGHVTAEVYDAADQGVQHILPDGVVEKRTFYNALSQEERYQDARGQTWTRRFNHRNQIIQLTLPSGQKRIYVFNEIDEHMSSSDGLGNTYRFNYDERKNVSERYLPMGQGTHMTYDRNHEPLTEVDIDGTQTWTRDYWGTEVGSTDLSGAQYTMTLDHKKQLVRRQSQGGNHGNYRDFDPLAPQSTTTEPVPPQNLSYTWVSGRLMKIEDHAHDRVAVYDYDSEHRRVRAILKRLYPDEQGKDREMILHDVAGYLDALGRTIGTWDTNAVILQGHDAVGNKRCLVLSIYVQNKSSGQKTVRKEVWYTFDAANRVIVNGGELKNREIQIIPGQGTILAYDQGYRYTEESQDQGGTRYTRRLTFNGDGLLTSIDKKKSSDPDSSYRRESTRRYDGTNRQEYYETDPAGKPYDKDTSTYDGNGEVTKSQQCHRDKQTQQGTITLGYTGTGRVVTQVSDFTIDDVTQDKTHTIRDDLKSTYVGYHDQKLSKIGGTRTQDGRTGDYSSVEEGYDANGMLQYIQGAESDSNGYYDADLETGQAILRWDTGDGAHVTQYLTDVDGAVLGSYRVPYSPGRHVWDDDTYSWTENITFMSGGGMGGMGRRRKISDSFKQSVKVYTPIHSGQEAWDLPLPDVYTVMAGDTFASISQKLYGTEDHAGILAELNGWTATSHLTTGQILLIPPMIESLYGAESAIPYYQLMAKITGSLYPHMKAPKPKSQPWWKKVLAVVVGIIVAVVTICLGGGPTASWLQQLITAGIAGALSNAASQLTAIKLGIQEHFALKSVLQSTLEMLIVRVGLPPTAELMKQDWWLILAKAGGISLTEQIVEHVLGLRGKIDFRSIITQAVAMTLGAKLGKITAAESRLAQQGAQSVMRGLVSAAVYGQISPEGFAMQYLQDLAGELTQEGLETLQEMRASEVIPAEPATSSYQQQTARTSGAGASSSVSKPTIQPTSAQRRDQQLVEQDTKVNPTASPAASGSVPSRVPSSRSSAGMPAPSTSAAASSALVPTSSTAWMLNLMDEAVPPLASQFSFLEMVGMRNAAPSPSVFWQSIDAFNAFMGGANGYEGAVMSGAKGIYGAARALVHPFATTAHIIEGLGVLSWDALNAMAGTSGTGITAGAVQRNAARVAAVRRMYSDLSTGDLDTQASMLGSAAGTAGLVAGGGAGLSAISRTNGILKGVSETFQSERMQFFSIAPRVNDQLTLSRLGGLRGQVDAQMLNRLANTSNAQILYDTYSGHINVVQDVNDISLRITVSGDEFKIISVGPIRPRNIVNSIQSGRFIVIQDGFSIRPRITP